MTTKLYHIKRYNLQRFVEKFRQEQINPKSKISKDSFVEHSFSNNLYTYNDVKSKEYRVNSAYAKYRWKKSQTTYLNENALVQSYLLALDKYVPQKHIEIQSLFGEVSPRQKRNMIIEDLNYPNHIYYYGGIRTLERTDATLDKEAFSNVIKKYFNNNKYLFMFQMVYEEFSCVYEYDIFGKQIKQLSIATGCTKDHKTIMSLANIIWHKQFLSYKQEQLLTNTPDHLAEALALFVSQESLGKLSTGDRELDRILTIVRGSTLQNKDELKAAILKKYK